MNQVLSWNGSVWAPAGVSAGGYDPMAQTSLTLTSEWGSANGVPNWINCCFNVQGTLSTGGQPGTSSQYGVTQFNTSAGSGDGGWDAMGYDQFNGFLGDILSPANFKAFKWEGRIKLDQTTSERFRWGFCDAISLATPNNCVNLRYDTATDTNWQCEVRTGGASTVTPILAPDINWHIVSIGANASGALSCTIDSTTVTTTAAFPSTPLMYWPQFGMFTLTAAPRGFKVADFRLQIPPVPAGLGGGGGTGGGGTPGGTSGQVQINNNGAFAGLTIGGDALLSTSTGALTVTQIQGRPVSSTAPATNQVLAWSGTAWIPAAVSGGGGGAGASTAGQLGDLAVTMTSPTVLTIGASCSISSPCNVRFGSVVYTFTASATATVSAGSGLAYVFISSAGILTVGQNLGVTCSATCIAQSITAFPVDAMPLATWSAVNGVWGAGGGVDERAFLSTKTIVPGIGIVVSDSTGQAMVGVDSSTVGLRGSVPATATSSCVAGAWAADTSFYYVCVNTNTWRRAATAAW